MHLARAIGSSLLSLRSGLNSPLIGRNYMMHLCSIVVGVYSHASSTESSFVKQVGFADFYFGTRNYPHKMGIVQSLPVPGPLMTAKMSPFMPAPVRRFLRQRILPLAGIIEDLPNPANRVTLGVNGEAKLTHRFAKYDVVRRRKLTPHLKKILKRSGAVYCTSRQQFSDEHVAHQCGTLRFGNDPAHAVLDADCRMYADPNVFAVDSSFCLRHWGSGPALRSWPMPYAWRRKWWPRFDSRRAVIRRITQRMSIKWEQFRQRTVFTADWEGCAWRSSPSSWRASRSLRGDFGSGCFGTRLPGSISRA